MSRLVNVEVNIWFWLLVVAVAFQVVIWRGGRKRERTRRHLLTAFASRNVELVFSLAASMDAEEERLWRRLITARLALEESEKGQSQARRDLEDVLASLQDAVLVVDDEGRLRFLNAAALRLFEVRIEEALGANLIEALPSFGLDAAMRAALRDGNTSANEVHLYSPRIREVFLRVAPVFSTTGLTSGAVAILQDLTEMRRLERVRRDFVANASHELRTPIANIRATAETLLHAPDDAQLIARFLPPLINEAERLSRLVADLLDLARAEADEPLPHEPVDMALIVNNVVERLRDKATRRELNVPWTRSTEKFLVLGDGAGLEQVVFNLVDNAISYTPSGGTVSVTIQAQIAVPKDASGVTRASVILQVTDTGIGIPQADLPRVFERFYRVDKARSRAEGGTGLGLAIVKHIVESHGGRVEIQSSVGKGSTFSIELPLQVEAGNPA